MSADIGRSPGRSIQILLYMLYCLLTTSIYGLFAFFVIYRGLSGEVMLYAYLLNIAFIILFLVLDKLANDILLSKEFVITKNNYLIALIIHSASVISFKTTLYLFYTFILIVSRISILQPGIISDNFQNFVFSIEYCLILLVVFDKFIEYLLKDDKRVKRISAKFMKFERFITARRGKSK